MGKNDLHAIFTAYNSSGATLVVIELRKNGSGFQIRAGTLTDLNKWSYTPWITLSSGWQSIAFDWHAATAAGANNGSLSLTMSSTAVSVSALDNDTRRVDWIASVQ